MTQLSLFACPCGEPRETGPHGTDCPGAEEVLGHYTCRLPGGHSGCGSMTARLPGELCESCARQEKERGEGV